MKPSHTAPHALLFHGKTARTGLWFLIAVCSLTFLGLHAWNLNNRFIDFKWDGATLGSFSHQLWSIAHGVSPLAGTPVAESWYQVPAALYLLAPLYRAWPDPLFLPIVQVVALTAAAIGIFFIGSRFLTKGRATILAVLFCFYPPVYAMCAVSFHPAVLAVPFLTFSILSLLTSRVRLAAFFAVMVLVCDLRAGLIAAPLCLWAARSTKRGVWGWLALAAALSAAGVMGWRPLEADGMGPMIVGGALTAPYLFWSLCALEQWADRILSKRSLLLALISPVFFAGAVFASAMLTPAIMESHPAVSKTPVRTSALWSLIQRIPDDAHVLTTRAFFPRFSNRTNVALLGDTELPASAKGNGYALAELGGADANLDLAEEAGRALKALVRAGWAPVASMGGVVLFSDAPAEALSLYTPDVDLSVDRPYLALGASAVGGIELVGFTMSPDASDPDQIHFSFYWRKLKAAATAFAPQLSVVDANGRSVYSVRRLLCYGLYPFEEWAVGEVVKDEFMFVVPERLKKTSYEVRLGLLDRPASRPVPLGSSVQGALDTEGRVRLIALDAI